MSSSRCCESSFADHNPAYIAASFDLAGPTFRDEIAADYKANRVQMPDDLVEQINWVHEACEAMGVPILTVAGYEADDVIGTIATRAAAAGHNVAIVSIDKDFFQLVRDGAISVYDPREDGAWFDERGVLEKFGVKPSQVVDVLALVGDTSDNVAGVPGIGKKGAIDLVTQFGSLDGLLAHTLGAEGKTTRGTRSPSRTGLAEPATRHDSHRHAARVRFGISALSWRVARALLRALHSSGVQNTGQRLRADSGFGRD